MRRMKKIYCPGNFRIEPWDSRFYALFQEEDLICVTAYKKGALKVMDLLYSLEVSLDRLNQRGMEPFIATNAEKEEWGSQSVSLRKPKFQK